MYKCLDLVTVVTKLGLRNGTKAFWSEQCEFSYLGDNLDLLVFIKQFTMIFCISCLQCKQDILNEGSVLFDAH